VIKIRVKYWPTKPVKDMLEENIAGSTNVNVPTNSVGS
jgi:hypothetical protein